MTLLDVMLAKACHYLAESFLLDDEFPMTFVVLCDLKEHLVVALWADPCDEWEGPLRHVYSAHFQNLVAAGALNLVDNLLYAVSAVLNSLIDEAIQRAVAAIVVEKEGLVFVVAAEEALAVQASVVVVVAAGEIVLEEDQYSFLVIQCD